LPVTGSPGRVSVPDEAGPSWAPTIKVRTSSRFVPERQPTHRLSRERGAAGAALLSFPAWQPRWRQAQTRTKASRMVSKASPYSAAPTQREPQRSRRKSSAAVLAAPAFVASLNDVAVVGETIEQRGRHLGVAEYAGPFREVEVGRDDDGRAFVEPANEVEQ
jgi:hypothetical protein